MLDVSSPQALFGEEAVTDRKKLRREYARLIKRFRPETSPDEFAQIHALYQQALQALKGNRRSRVADLPPPADPDELKRKARVRHDEAPPKWEQPDRQKERSAEPPPDWERADRQGDDRDEAPPEWERAGLGGEERKDEAPPEWERADQDRGPPPDQAPPEWQRVDHDAERPPDAAPDKSADAGAVS